MHMKNVKFRPTRPRLQQTGLSLVELMISIAIGLILLAGITALMVQQDSSSRELAKSGRVIENGRYAAQILRDDIELAGYFGEFFRLPDPSSLSDPTTLVNPCSVTAATLADGMTLPIQAYDSPTALDTDLATCLDAANHLDGTDILVIRRADTAVLPKASAMAGQPYLQVGLTAGGDFSYVVGTGADPAFTLTTRNGDDSRLRRYLTHIYFVSPCHRPANGAATCNAGADGGSPVPTLKRMELGLVGGAAAFTVVPIAEGIENLQFDFGVDSADADGSADYYTSGTNTDAGTAMTPADWANVMTVRVNILARNLEPTPGHTESKSYVLGLGTTVSPTDNFKRRVFTETVRAINPSGRRAQ